MSVHWFPDPYFPLVLGFLVFGTLLVDYGVPLALRRHCPDYRIRLLGLVGIAATVACRSLNWTVVPSSVQYTGLLLIYAGLIMRAWAVLKVGNLFARTAQGGQQAHFITVGPYRWLRHPVYAGLIVSYLGIALAIGTWLGAAITLGAMLAAAMYRIRVEEQRFLETFGNEYRDYMSRTWRLFPGW
jgi:protein-S-isoprenylcysteine O-methyltransferase Ste14